ncbi:galactose oxidase [Backusella circina FSU 941]|nr:galactose oxidase [Backusella circina FSU 941]
MLFGGKPLLDEPYDGHLYLYNTNQKKWKRIKTQGYKPMERSGHSITSTSDTAYIWGGKQNNNYFDDLFTFNINTVNKAPKWELVHYRNRPPKARSGHVSVIFEQTLYIFGGTDGEVVFNDLWGLNLTSLVWTQIDAQGFVPSARERCGCALVDDVFYILGGKDKEGGCLNDIYSYRIKARRWYKFQGLGSGPNPKHSLTITRVKETLYVVGGDNDRIKLDDNYVYLLNSGMINYPPIPDSVIPDVPVRHSHYPGPDVTSPSRPMSVVPVAALKRVRATSPKEPSQINDVQLSLQIPPKRPPRQGIRNTIQKIPQNQDLMNDIKQRNQIINEMKEKEDWWRKEVAKARKEFKRESDPPEADENLLLELDGLPETRFQLFERLVSLKTELRRVKASIPQLFEPMLLQVEEAGKIKTAAIQEAAYFKSKCIALQKEPGKCEELEKELSKILSENEANNRLLRQLEKKAQYDTQSLVATEDRAHETQLRAQEAHEAYARTLDDLKVMKKRQNQAESHIEDDAVKISQLNKHLSEALQAQPLTELSEHLELAQSEAANLKARNETAILKHKLEEHVGDRMRLCSIINEREDALAITRGRIEDCEIQLSIMKTRFDLLKTNAPMVSE